MATLTPFFSDKSTPVQPGRTTIAPETMSALTDASARGAQTLAEGWFQMAGQMSSLAGQYGRSAFDAQERFVQNELEKANFLKFDEMAGMIDKGVSEEQLRLIKLREARRLDQLPSMEKTYLTTQSIQFQEQYMNARRELQLNASPDGAGYLNQLNEWFDTNISKVVESAPSDVSKAEMLDRLGSMRLGAIADGIKFEDNRRAEYTVQQSDASVASLSKQALLAPENFDAYIEQVGALKENLISMGVDPATAEKWMSKSQESVASGFMYRQIKDDPASALEMLSGDFANLLSPNSLIEHMSQATNEYKAKMKGDMQNLDTAQSIAKIQSKLPLNPDDPQDKKALNDYYSVSTAPLRNPDGTFNQPPAVVAQALANVVSQTPSMIPEKFKDDFRNAVIYGNTQQAESFSKMIGVMQKDPTIAPALSKLDGNALQMGIYINNAISSGTDPAQAHNDAKNRFLVKSGSPEESRMKSAQSILTTEFIRGNLEGEFSSWVAPIVGVSEWTLGEGFKPAARQFFDPTNLEDASAEYSRHFVSSYGQFGDPTVADQYAKTQLHKTFASTTVNGQNEVMQWAPNVVFPGRDKDFRQTLYKSINPESDGYTKPTLNIDGAEYEWMIDSKDQFGFNYAKQHGAYPMYYVDAEGYKRPLLDENGLQKMFVYTQGLTHDELEAAKDAKERQDALQEQFAKGVSRLGEIQDRIRRSPGYEKMTPQQRQLLEAQLAPSIIGK